MNLTYAKFVLIFQCRSFDLGAVYSMRDHASGNQPLSPIRIERMRCPACNHARMQRAKRPFQYEVSHDGRPPVAIRIPDLEVIACANPDCRPGHADDNIVHDDATTWQITVETYKQLGLLTPAEIRAGRERLELTQQELQQLLGLGGNSLSRWETGRVYQSRSVDTLLRLAFQVPDVIKFLRQPAEPRR